MASTMKDVAKLAGVSLKTVSNVMNNNSARYSPETRDVVLDAVRKLNYRPNRAARYMRTGTIEILALAVPDIGNAYFSEIAREVIDAAKEKGYTVLIEHTAGQAEIERRLIEELSTQTVDGIILDPVTLTEPELQKYSSTRSIVLIGERAAGECFDHIMVDNVAAAQVVTSHLAALGRKRIAILPVVPDKPLSLFTMRYQGYLAALREAGITPDLDLVVRPRHPATLTPRDGMDCMEQLIEQGKIPDAVFCLNDRVALGAMKVLRQHGYRIPEDVAVAGFDNIVESNLTSPALTTISPDKRAIGQLAVKLLIQRIQGIRSGPPEQFNPSFELIIRESTAGTSV